MTTAAATPIKEKWYEKFLIWALGIYLALGLFSIPAFFTHMDTDARIFQLVFALPVTCLIAWKVIVKPLLILLGITLAIFLNVLPIILTGFFLAVGGWLALHIL